MNTNTGTATISSQILRSGKCKFPLKLMHMLECNEYNEIVCWSPCGLLFSVQDIDQFEKKVLPEVFKQAKFSSFERKLIRWGFKKAKSNRRTKAKFYGHPLFRRGDFMSAKEISTCEGQAMSAALLESLQKQYKGNTNQTIASNVNENANANNLNFQQNVGTVVDNQALAGNLNMQMYAMQLQALNNMNMMQNSMNVQNQFASSANMPAVGLVQGQVNQGGQPMLVGVPNTQPMVIVPNTNVISNQMMMNPTTGNMMPTMNMANLNNINMLIGGNGVDSLGQPVLMGNATGMVQPVQMNMNMQLQQQQLQQLQQQHENNNETNVGVDASSKGQIDVVENIAPLPLMNANNKDDNNDLQAGQDSSQPIKNETQL